MKSRRIDSFLATREKIEHNWDWWSRFLQREYYGSRSEIMNWNAAERSISTDLNLMPGQTVLDLGSGSGELEFRFALRGIKAVGVEQSAALVDDCRRTAVQRGLPGAVFICADMFEFTPEEKFDAVLSLNTSCGYGTDEQNRSLIGRIAEWLKPGGTLYLDTVIADNAQSFGSWSDYLAGGTLIVDNTWDPENQLMTSWPYWLPPEAPEIYAADRPEIVRIYSIAEIEGMLSEAGFRAKTLQRAMGRHMRQDGASMMRTWIALKEE